MQVRKQFGVTPVGEENFASRLKELIGHEPANRFAREVDIGESLLRKYLAGATPGLDKVVAIAQAKGVSLDWLALGVGPKRLSPNPSQPEADFVVETESGPFLIELKRKTSGPKIGEQLAAYRKMFALIPRLDVQASAGLGRLALDEDPLEYLAFQADWLRARGVKPEAARVLTAKGDSMEETIRDGDILLVDTSVNRIRDNSIYVVVYGDMVLVKRIHGRINGSLQLISDNPRYPAEEVSAGEVDQINIAGRVMWFGRSI